MSNDRLRPHPYHVKEAEEYGAAGKSLEDIHDLLGLLAFDHTLRPPALAIAYICAGDERSHTTLLLKHGHISDCFHILQWRFCLGKVPDSCAGHKENVDNRGDLCPKRPCNRRVSKVAAEDAVGRSVQCSKNRVSSTECLCRVGYRSSRAAVEQIPDRRRVLTLCGIGNPTCWPWDMGGRLRITNAGIGIRMYVHRKRRSIVVFPQSYIFRNGRAWMRK